MDWISLCVVVGSGEYEGCFFQMDMEFGMGQVYAH
jgi:hypothetical protein